SVLANITVEQSSLAQPQLQLSNSKLDFGANIPGVVSKKDFILKNVGGRQLTWQAGSDQSWLTVSPNTGAFSGSGTTQVVVNSGTLAPQSYSGHITFIQRGSGNQPLTLTVTMTVKTAPPASLIITPVSLTYSGTPNQNPADQVITLQNTGGQPLDWSRSVVTGDGASWLSSSPASGNLAPHTSKTITISVRSQQLAPGSYQGTINFKGGTNPAVTVALSVATPGNLIASPPSLSFASVGQNPAAQSISLQNSGGEPLDWSVTAATVDGSHWLNPSPASGHLEMNQAADVAININAAALNPQSYQGTLTFTYGGGLTKQVPVSLSVSIPPAPAIGLNQSSLNFTTIQGTNAAPLSFMISNTGNAMLAWVIAEDQNGATFAHLSATSGSLAPQKSASITVTPNTAQANVGTLTTNITVADSDTGSRVPTQKVTVSIVVQGKPQVALSASSMNFSQDSVITESSQLLDISNTGSKTLNWVTQSSASWLSVDIPNGTLDPGKDLLINVHCNSSSLMPGTYTATFVVRDNNSGTAVTSQTLAVTLVVS
ncbi:MAG: choice-of-anchor D domain-containing protein, partial [Chloroflexota bacterium]|nr:choice-of-anchor D domain-containing protein [Chloroflexota bacterium]